jgi:hypothetical protein
MRAVAELLIQADINAVAARNPPMIWRGLVPMNPIIKRAIRTWTFHFSIAIAMKKPPIKRKTIGLPYSWVTAKVSMVPKSGKRTMGRREVIAIGTDSDTHQTMIQAVVPATTRASHARVPDSQNRRRRKRSGPLTSPAARQNFSDNSICSGTISVLGSRVIVFLYRR